MDILKTNVLDEEQKQKISALEQLCFEEEPLCNHVFMSNEINYDRTIPVFYLAYENELLVGFLTFFIPTKEEVEISALVHPKYRRMGIFTALEQAARVTIAENGIGSIIYNVERAGKSAACVLKSRNITELVRSEYRMKITGEALSKLCEGTFATSEGFGSRRVSAETLTDYMSISGKAFGSDETERYGDAILNSDTRLGYLFYKNGCPIGTFAIGLEQKDEPFIYGVAITESERGRGYGKFLMQQACLIAKEYSDTLWLDVDSLNPAALRLYTGIGFEITFACDYYRAEG